MADGQRNSPKRPAKQPLAVYIHWPYCQKRCPYCDFNAYAVPRAFNEADWRQALVLALERALRPLADHHQVDSIFFGGGTPSLMSAESVGACLQAVAACIDVSGNREVTLEANPGSSDQARFAGYVAAGVNRLSLGVQSLCDDQLRFLGRLHSAEQSLAAIDAALREAGRVSVDMIYALPRQTGRQWHDQLTRVLDRGLEHLSLYQLTIEPGTVFHRQRQRGQLQELCNPQALALYRQSGRLCAAYGLERYEVSNHAREGQYARHNWHVWQYQPYIGVGPGAHGRIPGANGSWFATVQTRAPGPWLRSVLDGNEQSCSALTMEAVQVERLLLGLRTIHGVALAAVAMIVDHRQLVRLRQSGDIQEHQARIRVSRRALVRLDRIIAQLVRDDAFVKA